MRPARCKRAPYFAADRDSRSVLAGDGLLDEIEKTDPGGLTLAFYRRPPAVERQSSQRAPSTA